MGLAGGLEEWQRLASVSISHWHYGVVSNAALFTHVFRVLGQVSQKLTLRWGFVCQWLRKGSKEKAVRVWGNRIEKGKEAEARLVRSQPPPDPKRDSARPVSLQNRSCPKEPGFLLLQRSVTAFPLLCRHGNIHVLSAQEGSRSSCRVVLWRRLQSWARKREAPGNCRWEHRTSNGC